jgi:VWFA-related protein
MKQAKNERKALVILSDGGDNFSRRSLNELKSALLEADVQVYSMGVFDHDLTVKHTREERDGPKLLGQMALDTGGCEYPITSLDGLPDVGVQIARALRNQYVLGYAPGTMTNDGKYHKIALTLAATSADQDLRAYYRRGYYAPLH